jgi:Ca2+:H+ antiporter
MKSAPLLPLWTIATPVVAWLLYGGTLFGLSGAFLALVVAGLIGSVLSAVHHAEVVAHRVGEPFGTMVLAIAVTVIEVALIVSLMLAGGPETTALARDTVFAAVMIILTGMVGLCLLVGGAQHREQSFMLHGVSASLATLAAIVVLTLVLPNYTTSSPGPAFTGGQLAFIAVVSLILYGTFVFAQAVRHRDYFLPPQAVGDEAVHAEVPSNRIAAASALLLLACLGVVVLLAKALGPSIEAGVAAMGAPAALVGVIIAAVVLFPEGTRGVARRARQPAADEPQPGARLGAREHRSHDSRRRDRVARHRLEAHARHRHQVDGSARAVAVRAAISLGTGRTTLLQGTVLLVIFATYLFTTIVP